jgi:hypothetical protein
LDADELLQDATGAAREMVGAAWDRVVQVAVLIHSRWRTGEVEITGEEIEALLAASASVQ